MALASVRPIRGSKALDTSYSPQTRKRAQRAFKTKIVMKTICRAGSALWIGWMRRFIQIPFLGLAIFVVLLRSFCQSCGLQTLIFFL